MPKIRDATLDDFVELYNIGLTIPELRVTDDRFMTEDEFKWHITNPNGSFYIAEENNKVVGFACLNLKERGKDKFGCLVYLVVLPKYRRKGIATELYQKIESRAKELDAAYIYSWMDAESKPIQDFFKKQNYTFGQPCIWIDKKLKD